MSGVAGGLVLLGDITEGHLEVDYDRIQSLIGQGGTALPLRLQPAGGNLILAAELFDPYSAFLPLQNPDDLGFGES